jgi:serine/threonine protein kinase
VDSPARAATGATNALVGADVEEHFEVTAKAGTGGMGVVYDAHHRATGERVALKLLNASDGNIERFALECDVLERLDHPCIVKHIDHGTTASGAPYLAMEWLDGVTLSHLLRRGPLSPRATVQFGVKLSDALAAAHDRQIIHRDLKPSNIFLVDGDPCRPKILDFGIARLREGHWDLTITNQIVGTPGYMAPEQAKGVRDVDARADVFALGCVLFHAVTGSPPFEGPDVLTVLAKLATEHPPSVGELVADVPEALENLISSMLKKHPDGRPASAAEIATELRTILRYIEKNPDLHRPRAAADRTLSAECIVFAQPKDGASPLARTELQSLAETVAVQGGELQSLFDGSIVIRILPQATMQAQATAASRCASEIVAHDSFRVAIASHVFDGASSERSEGDPIEHARLALHDAPPGRIRIVATNESSPFHREIIEAIEGGRMPFELAPTVATSVPVSKRLRLGSSRKLTTSLAALGGAAVGALAIILAVRRDPLATARTFQSRIVLPAIDYRETNVSDAPVRVPAPVSSSVPSVSLIRVHPTGVSPSLSVRSADASRTAAPLSSSRPAPTSLPAREKW